MKCDIDRVMPSRQNPPSLARLGQKGGTVPRVVLGARDIALLVDVALCRVLRRRQIERLHFSSTPRCNYRLHQLARAGLLVQTYPPVASQNGEALYLLGRAAVPLVASALREQSWQIETEELMLQCRRGLPMFLAHTLALADCYVGVRNGLRNRPGWRLDRWLPEPWCHDEYQVRARKDGATAGADPWRKVAFKPDAFFRLSRANGSLHAFLEADMGHASAQRIAYKLRLHQEYQRLGLFRTVYGADDFHTLLVTTNTARVTRLETLAASLSGHRLWLTTFAALAQGGMLGNVWRRAGLSGLWALTEEDV